MSASNTSSATTTLSAGSSSAVVHDSSVVLPDPGGPANTIDSRACTQAASTAATGAIQHVALDVLAQRAERDAGSVSAATPNQCPGRR
jgi:hypothetical protein